jgi:NAD-dependent SIR2 family protein deacetylase
MVTAQADSPATEQAGDIARLVAGKRVAVLTGAGISTDSGIPDYRGQGASKRTPMKFADFIGSVEYRRRYWAGAHLGWRRFAAAEPNRGHIALAAMEQFGAISGIVSQNVDGLHRRAGSAHVVDLHGTLSRVGCVECGQMYDRESVEHRVALLNPWLAQMPDPELAPDGDSDVEGWQSVEVPECTVCGGILKPDVVFFGENVPLERVERSVAAVDRAEVLLVIGTSLAVNSGVRFARQAAKAEKPIIVVNVGPTKADVLATVKLEVNSSVVLPLLFA